MARPDGVQRREAGLAQLSSPRYAFSRFVLLLPEASSELTENNSSSKKSLLFEMQYYCIAELHKCVVIPKVVLVSEGV